MRRRTAVMIALLAILVLLLPISAQAGKGSDFIVSGASGYTYDADGVLTFTSPGSYEVSMNAGVTSTATDTIRVDCPGGTINLTVNNINIDVSATAGACAFELGADSTLNLTLAGASSLKSGAGQAGLHVPPNTSLTIDGPGSLTATGTGSSSVKGGAGIGGDGNVGYMLGETSGQITIQGGTVTAYGGSGEEIVGFTGYSYGGAGIGGGGGAGGLVTISGGTVNATGGSHGAGIGGGVTDLGGTNIVNISGGRVTANGGSFAAGIGGASSMRCGIVSISGGTVIARGGSGDMFISGGPSIGNGTGNSNAYTVTITGGSVNMTDGSHFTEASYRSIKDGSSRDLYLTTVYLQFGENAAVDSLSVTSGGAYPYGVHDIVADDMGRICLYLPNGANTTEARSGSNKFLYKTGEEIITTTTGLSAGTLYLYAQPTVTSFSPSGTMVSVSTHSLSITFSEGVVKVFGGGFGSIQADHGLIIDTNHATWSSDGTTVTCPFSSSLAYRTTYNVTVADFTGTTSTHAMDPATFSFTTEPITITATAGAGGQISPCGIVAVTPGGDQKFTITPDDGYSIDYVAVDGSNVGQMSSYTFENISAPHTIEAGFVRDSSPNPVPTSTPTPVTLALSSSDSDGVIYMGGRITLTPNIAGGTWSWDKTFFSATFNSPATFTALKAGTSTITYKANNQTVSYTVTVRDSSLPLTGQDSSSVWMLCGAALLALAAASLLWRRPLRKKTI